MDLIPFLLAPDALNDQDIKKFNSLKRKENPAFVRIEYNFEIRSRPELRADNIWSKLVPKHQEGMSAWDARYVLVPVEFAPYVVVQEYDGAESYHIDYNRFGITKIKDILANKPDAEKLAAIQEIIDRITANQ